MRFTKHFGAVTIGLHVDDSALPEGDAESRLTISKTVQDVLDGITVVFDNLVKLASHRLTRPLAPVLSLRTIEDFGNTARIVDKYQKQVAAGKLSAEEIAASELLETYWEEHPLNDFIEHNLDWTGFDPSD